jgi:hypothetical protein
MAACLALAIAGSVAVRAPAAEPAEAVEGLLRLVPSDASLVLTIEGLRDHVRRIGASRLASDLRRLPAVKSWLESEKYRHLERSCAEIERTLGVKLADVRDQVLGDAVVLVVRLPRDDRLDASQARGLLLLRARDPALLERLIAAVNRAQRGSDELERVGDRRRGETTYHVREFPDGSGRPPEWYVSYADGTFAFSNSEDLIRGVIDRKARESGGSDAAIPRKRGGGHDEAGPGLAASSRLLGVRRRLPERPLARLYLDPRAIERLLASAPRPAKPTDVRIRGMLERHLAAVEYAGAALVCRPDAIVVHAVETLDPSRVDGWLRRWAADTRASRPECRRVPRTALAVASAHVDGTALREAIYRIVPEADHQRLRNLEAVLTGLMLGQDFSSRVLPKLGPGLIAYLDGPSDSTAETAGAAIPPPARGGLFPLVVVIGLSRDGEPGVAISDAVENALRTLMALLALDEKRGQGRGAILSSDSAGVSVTTLSTPIPFAYAVDRTGGRLVLGSSASAVARYFESASDPKANARFREVQAASFAEYETFVYVDLEALSRLAEMYRERLARNLAARQKRPAAEVGRDLEQVLALTGLFRSAFVASRIEPDASAIHRRLGVILKDSSGLSAAPP